MRHSLVAKQLVHLFQRPALGLWEEKEVAPGSNQVPGEKEVKKAEAEVLQRNRRALCENEVKRPVGERAERIAAGADLDRKNLWTG